MTAITNNCKFSKVDTEHDFKKYKAGVGEFIIREGATKVTPTGINCSTVVYEAGLDEDTFFSLVLNCILSGPGLVDIGPFTYENIKTNTSGTPANPDNINYTTLTCNSINGAPIPRYTYSIHKHTKTNNINRDGTPFLGNVGNQSEGLKIMFKLGLHKLITHTNGRINMVYDATSGAAFKRCFQSDDNRHSYSNMYQDYFTAPASCAGAIHALYPSYRESNTIPHPAPPPASAIAALAGHQVSVPITSYELFTKTIFNSPITLNYLASPVLSADPAQKPKSDSRSWIFDRGANVILQYNRNNADHNIDRYSAASPNTFFSNIQGTLQYGSVAPPNVEVNAEAARSTDPTIIFPVHNMNKSANITNVTPKLSTDNIEKAMYLQFKKMGDQNQGLFIKKLLVTDPLCNPRNTILLTNDRMLLAFCLANGISCGMTIGRPTPGGLSSVITFIKNKSP